MKKLIRTTITLPEDIYQQAKIKASLMRESFSAYVASSLQQRMSQMRVIKEKNNPKNVMGVFSLGIKKLPKREKLYEKIIRKKLGG